MPERFEDEIEARITQAVAAHLDTIADRFADRVADRVADVRRREPPALSEADVSRVVTKTIGSVFGVDLEKEPTKLRDGLAFSLSLRDGASKTAWTMFTGFIMAIVGAVAMKLGFGK